MKKSTIADETTSARTKDDQGTEDDLSTSAPLEQNRLLPAAFCPQTKDIAHLYIGCDVQTKDGIGKLIGIVKDEVFIDYRGYENKGYTDEFGNEYDFVFLENEYFVNDVKLMLRPLSDMKEDEAIEVTKPIVVYGDLSNVRKYETWENQFGKIVVSWGEGLREKYCPQSETAFTSKQIVYLLSRNFDLFGMSVK